MPLTWASLAAPGFRAFAQGSISAPTGVGGEKNEYTGYKQNARWHILQLNQHGGRGRIGEIVEKI